MQKLYVDKKTGFSSLLPFKIFDSNGLLFYADFFTNKIKNGERLKFNLPAGNYFVDGFLVQLAEPIKQKHIELPKPQREIPYTRYKIKFGENPHKCTIYYNDGLILFDKSFLSKPLYMRYNVYFHELGHHLYGTEKYADLFALKKMLELGFNLSQVGYGTLYTLSDKQRERKKFISNHLKN
jgi:hypothetical protein